MRHLVGPEVGIARNIAQPEAGNQIKKPYEFGRFVPWISDKPFVGAFASEHDFLSTAVDFSRKLEQRGAGGIDDGRFGRGNQSGIRLECVLVPKILHDWRLGPDMAGGKTCGIEFVEIGLVHADRVGIDGWAFQMAGQRHDHAGVHAARKISAHRNISAQSLFDGLEEKLFEIIHQPLGIIAPFLTTLIGKIHFPKRTFLHNCFRAVSACWRDAQVMPSRQKVDAFETRSWTGDGRERKDVIDASAIRSRRDHTRCEEPFDLGCEKQPIVLPAPKERRYTKTIAAELELESYFVP